MSLFAKVRETLASKGYMPTRVGINGKLNAVTVESPFALSLFNELRNVGAEVSFHKHTDSVLIFDEPSTFFKHLEAL